MEISAEIHIITVEISAKTHIITAEISAKTHTKTAELEQHLELKSSTFSQNIGFLNIKVIKDQQKPDWMTNQDCELLKLLRKPREDTGGITGFQE